MRAQLLKYWDLVWSGFWFLPSLMVLGAGLLSLATVSLDQAVADQLGKFPSWAYSGTADGASAVLQTISGSMVTIAGVVFSMTLVALSLASQQFGPRLLRNFMRDPVNQVVLGTFVSTFLYCLLVLRTIRRGDDSGFVPNISVTLGVLFALTSLGVLIYFIHHVSTSIQADQIVARVHAELLAGIDRLCPDACDAADNRPAAAAEQASSSPPAGPAAGLQSTEDGYVQFVDTSSLLSLAEEHDLTLRMDVRPGQYIVACGTLLRVWPRERCTDELSSQLRRTIAIGAQRTPAQDLELSIQELVEIAVRALSPGINDPFTAMSCLDRLGSGLCRLANRQLKSLKLCDGSGRLRVTGTGTTFDGAVNLAFHQIRQNSTGNTAVTIRLLEVLRQVALIADPPETHAVLRRHADIVLRGAQEALREPVDLRDVQDRYDALLETLGKKSLLHSAAGDCGEK